MWQSAYVEIRGQLVRVSSVLICELWCQAQAIRFGSKLSHLPNRPTSPLTKNLHANLVSLLPRASNGQRPYVCFLSLSFFLESVLSLCWSWIVYTQQNIVVTVSKPVER